MMKIVTKMLANRLKQVLPSIIAETQSAFVPGRLITDNAIAAFEINHWMHRKTKGKIGYAALKIDMSKAYDRVEWDFVMGVMRRMGFAEKWCNWIFLCLSTVSYKFVVSGNEIGPVLPSRGLRQGIQFLPIFSYCVQKVCQLLYIGDK